MTWFTRWRVRVPDERSTPGLLAEIVDGYVAEMEAAWESFRRGEGPNGEPAGTWETDTHELRGYRCL